MKNWFENWREKRKEKIKQNKQIEHFSRNLGNSFFTTAHDYSVTPEELKKIKKLIDELE